MHAPGQLNDTIMQFTCDRGDECGQINSLSPILKTYYD